MILFTELSLNDYPYNVILCNVHVKHKLDVVIWKKRLACHGIEPQAN